MRFPLSPSPMTNKSPTALRERVASASSFGPLSLSLKPCLMNSIPSTNQYEGIYRIAVAIGSSVSSPMANTVPPDLKLFCKAMSQCEVEHVALCFIEPSSVRHT